MRRFRDLSRRQRCATPPALAQWLVSQVREQHACLTVACLWLMRGSAYYAIRGTDCWGVQRDARLYAGPHPIVAHPPCGPWGKLRHRCRESREDGIIAMDLVHRWGGVVEHPVGSSLFREFGHWWAPRITTINQGEWGCLCLKPTMLYWVGSERTGP